MGNDVDAGSFTDFAEEKRKRSYLNEIQGTAEGAVSFFDKLCGRKLKSSWEHRMVEIPEIGSEAERVFEEEYENRLRRKMGK